VKPHRYVVLAQRVRGFDDLSEAKRFANANYPCVVMERVTSADGSSTLIEVARHDYLYDEARGEWRVMLA
jgi:hypothetical protein